MRISQNSLLIHYSSNQLAANELVTHLCC